MNRSPRIRVVKKSSPIRQQKTKLYPFQKLPYNFSRWNKAELLKLAKKIRLTWQKAGGRNMDINALDDFTVKQLRKEIRDHYTQEYKQLWDNLKKK